MNKKIYNLGDIQKLKSQGVSMGDILNDDSFKVYTPGRKLVPPERKREFFKGVGLFDIVGLQSKNGKFMT
jgi:hypothetical protein